MFVHQDRAEPLRMVFHRGHCFPLHSQQRHHTTCGIGLVASCAAPFLWIELPRSFGDGMALPPGNHFCLRVWLQSP